VTEPEGPITVDSQAWTGNEAEAAQSARDVYRLERRMSARTSIVGGGLFVVSGAIIGLVSLAGLLLHAGIAHPAKTLMTALGAIAFGLLGMAAGRYNLRRFRD